MFDGIPELLQPLSVPRLEHVLGEIGCSHLDARSVARAMANVRANLYGFERLDAGETALFGRQLEYVSTRIRETRRPELKWRTFVPVTSDAPAGAESWSYWMWDVAGMAEIVTNYADDIRKVGVQAKKFEFSIETFALGYDYSVIDLERASLAGVDYRNRKASQVGKGFELRFDKIAFGGYPGVKLGGLANNANVPVMNAAVVGGSSVWGSSGKAPTDVLADLLAMESAIITTTNGVEEPDSLLLPLDKYRYIQNTSLYADQPGSRPEDTIMSVFLRRAQSIRGIDWWLPLSKANAAGNGPRAIMYKRDPEHVHFEMPKPPTELPPQVQGLALAVNSWCRAGGVVFEYPLSAEYMDGI